MPTENLALQLMTAKRSLKTAKADLATGVNQPANISIFESTVLLLADYTPYLPEIILAAKNEPSLVKSSFLPELYATQGENACYFLCLSCSFVQHSTKAHTLSSSLFS